MNYIKTIISLFIAITMANCSNSNKESDKQNKTNNVTKISYVNQDNAQAKSNYEKGEMIVSLSTNKLVSALTKAIKERGAENAIDFCNQQALNITDSLATAENVIIRRVAKKNRNPINETNAFELNIYKQFIDSWIAQKSVDPKIVIDENGHPVFYKPIFIKKKCLTCHGTPGSTMPGNISAKIQELYPNDKATNFKDGDPRGMWAITFTDITYNQK